MIEVKLVEAFREEPATPLPSSRDFFRVSGLEAGLFGNEEAGI